MSEKIEIDKEKLIEFLWGICLADHLGDVMDEMATITKPLGIDGTMSQEELLDKLKLMDLIPEYQREVPY